MSSIVELCAALAKRRADLIKDVHGYTDGSSYTKPGSAVNHLCLPKQPQWGVYDEKVNKHPSVGGAVFNVYDIDIKNSLFDRSKYDGYSFNGEREREKQLCKKIKKISKMNAFASTGMFLLFSIGNKMLTAQVNRDVIFCESADLEIKCPMNTYIEVKSVNSGNAVCEQNVENVDCLRHFNGSIEQQCSTKNNCTISANEFQNHGCSRIPKFIKVKYTCTCTWFWWRSKYTELCTKYLPGINCDSSCMFIATDMKIDGIQENEVFCPMCLNSDVRESLSKLCKNSLKCFSPQNNNNCLFHPRFVKIQYSCQGDNMWSSLSPNSSAEPTETRASKNTNTTFTYVTPESSVHSTDGTTITIETPPQVQIDMQGRVLIYHPVRNKSFTVCGNQWDDNDAKVLCNYVDKSAYGIAYQMQAHGPINFTLQLEFQCTGNETSLFGCITKFDGYGCMISTVAAAKCCKGGNDSSECSSDKQSMMASTQSNIGLVLGLVLGLLLLVCVVILIVLYLRRSVGPKKKKQEQNSDSSRNEYIGTQDIAMPIANEHRPPYIHLEMKRNNQYHGITGGLSSMSEYEYSDINNASNEKSTLDKYTNQLDKKRDNMSHNYSAVLDQTKETSFIPKSKSTVNNYLVLDPNETGFNRSEGPEKTNGSYELAKPIHDIDLSKDEERKKETIRGCLCTF
ncbi:PRSS12 [Mytilus coruscus]|uniref:PRSS12 n=1 Tax=Mytilus coruscus TaxID=42192 RepID=A0A6J8C7Q6_MYTCO|nr:PRSS12 [Mytilus coruscus]